MPTSSQHALVLAAALLAACRPATPARPPESLRVWLTVEFHTRFGNRWNRDIQCRGRSCTVNGTARVPYRLVRGFADAMHRVTATTPVAGRAQPPPPSLSDERLRRLEDAISTGGVLKMRLRSRFKGRLHETHGPCITHSGLEVIGRVQTRSRTTYAYLQSYCPDDHIWNVVTEDHLHIDRSGIVEAAFDALIPELKDAPRLPFPARPSE